MDAEQQSRIATIGLMALLDEATGFQAKRAPNALQEAAGPELMAFAESTETAKERRVFIESEREAKAVRPASVGTSARLSSPVPSKPVQGS